MSMYTSFQIVITHKQNPSSLSPLYLCLYKLANVITHYTYLRAAAHRYQDDKISVLSSKLCGGFICGECGGMKKGTQVCAHDNRRHFIWMVYDLCVALLNISARAWRDDFSYIHTVYDYVMHITRRARTCTPSHLTGIFNLCAICVYYSDLLYATRPNPITTVRFRLPYTFKDFNLEDDLLYNDAS